MGEREILESESTAATLRRNITSQRPETSTVEQTMTRFRYTSFGRQRLNHWTLGKSAALLSDTTCASPQVGEQTACSPSVTEMTDF